MHPHNQRPPDHRSHSPRAVPARWRAAAAATFIAAGLAGVAPGIAAAHPSPVAISPLPGTPDASPDTQISILGVAAATIKSVTVTGSSSSIHAGHLKSYGSQPGASFLLNHPLTQGEHVSVTVRIAGRAPLRSSFAVATLPPTVAPFLSTSQQQPDKLQHFISQPSLLPPKITVNKAAPGLAGDIFLTPLPGPTVHAGGGPLLTFKPVGPGGPMIIDGRGRLVWFDQLPAGVEATNLRTATYDGRNVLTWWQGKVTAWAYGVGEGVIADHSYRVLARVRAGNGYAADVHELSVSPNGTALISIYSPVCVSTPCLPFPAGTNPAKWPLTDAVVEQVDIKTGLVEWEWHAMGHIPTSDAVVPPASFAFDAYHVNSIQALPSNKLLISLRDTSAIYEVDQHTGKIVWTLGGKHSSFKLGNAASFHFQHDARMLSKNQVSLFDDAAGPPIDPPGYSRGLVLNLDFAHKTATVRRQYARSTDTLADSEGNVQTLPGGDAFVGFGSTPFFSQFSARGALKFDAALPVDDGSYRVFRYPWKATPDTRPDLAVRRRSSTQVTLFASWNGATAVARWEVLVRNSAHKLVRTGSAPWSGFETKIAVRTSATTFEVRALDSHGRLLATSKPVTAA